MTILMADPRVAAVPVVERDEPLVAMPSATGVVRIRSGVALRLALAATYLPRGVHLKVVEGYRTPTDQRRIIEWYTRELRRELDAAGREELDDLVSRFVAPLSVAPHVSGGAVDLTLADDSGAELDLGTPIDATPEASNGACYFAAESISGEARSNRQLLAAALTRAGFVNYPTEWWHWSYGDRYWALVTGADHAHYAPVDARAAS